MARKRMIDPSFWTDEKIAQLSPVGKLLFIGLWNYADDEGIFKNNPCLIASQVFPYEDDIVKTTSECIKHMEDLNLIYCYSVHSQNYGVILNFKKHQTISHPQPSKMPKPCIQNTKYRESIFKRDGYVCAYCQRELTNQDKFTKPTIDHVVPQSKGGLDTPGNLTTSCEHCNKSKCDKSAESFMEHSRKDTGTFTPNIKEDKLIEDKLNKQSRFPPTVEEVAEYCKERNNGIDAEQFIAHYNSRGWKAGKTSITDWKSCVITWEKNKKEKQSTNPQHQFMKHDYDVKKLEALFDVDEAKKKEEEETQRLHEEARKQAQSNPDTVKQFIGGFGKI